LLITTPQQNKFHEAVVNLSKNCVERNVRLGPNIHGPGDGAEIRAIEEIVLADASVKAEIEKLQLPQGTVIISDPWIYGSDGVDDDDRMYQCFLYMRDPVNAQEVDSNHYAWPLPFSPVVSVETMSVIRVDILPMGADASVREVQPYIPRPPCEYLAEYQTPRPDLKPLNVVQPEGASFTVQEAAGGSVVEWQKWSMRVGFNQREGMVLYNVSLFAHLVLLTLRVDPYSRFVTTTGPFSIDFHSPT
jgi:primary-amine oxidase